MAEMPIEQDYNRFIPPIVDDTLDSSVEDSWEEPTDEQQLIENDDGSVTILDPEEDDVEDPEFDANLAESVPKSTLQSLASDYLEFIERDMAARERRDEQYEEGIRRTGLGDDAPGGATFNGASKVVHPVLAEGCVDFAARAIKELCPPNGPVRTQIIGKNTGQKLQRATRKRNYMNYQLMKQCPEFFPEIEQLLSQLPLGGSQYLKILPNRTQKRPEFEFVPVDKLIVPFAAASFYTAQRATHIQELTEQTFESRVSEGYYLDIDLATSIEPTETKTQKANNKVEGKTASNYNEDGLRTVFEVSTYLKLKSDKYTKGVLAPYILIIDESTQSVIGLYRNWEQEDEYFQKLDWIVEFKFIPWRGSLAIGLPHLIGGMAAALTGTLRALLDAAHVNNAPTALKLKGARFSGQTQSVDVTQIQEIEGVPGATDIRQIIMPFPFNPPSPVLFQLLDWLTNAAKGVVATAEEKISDASNQMPVGTALALIEQGSVNYAAIHMRLHHSMAKVLEIVQRINYDLLDEETVVEELGSEVVYRADFEDSSDVIPVSDPNIFSESQRYAQIQAAMQLATMGQQQGVQYDMHELHRRALEMMKIADADDILPPAPKPKELNAVAENVTVMLNNPIMVFPEQDHFSHIETHLRFVTDPNYGANPIVAGKVIPVLLEHIAQHIAFFYAENCEQVAQKALPQGPEAIPELDRLLAAVSASVAANSQQVFQPINAMLQQAQATYAKMAPQPQLDPASQVQKDIGMAEIQRQQQRDQGELQLKAQDQQLKAKESNDANQKALAEHVAMLQKQQAELGAAQEELAQRRQQLELDAATQSSKAEIDRYKAEAQAQLDQQSQALEKRSQDIDYRLKLANLRLSEMKLLQEGYATQRQNADNIEGMADGGLVEDEKSPMDIINQLSSNQDKMMQVLAALHEKPDHTPVILAALENLAKPRSVSVIRDKNGKAIQLKHDA